MRKALWIALVGVVGCGHDSAATLGVTTETIDAGAPDGTCLVGSSAADCTKCGNPDPRHCAAACTGEPVRWPTPVEYQAACATGECSFCQFDSWVTGFVHCETQCEALAREWGAIVASAPVQACQRREDCSVVETPYSCDCHPAIGGCGKPVNLSAYQSSAAPALAMTFNASCQQPGICDCGAPHGIDCVDGRCTVAGIGGCFALPDAGERLRRRPSGAGSPRAPLKMRGVKPAVISGSTAG
jgi:hypothetical protein